MYELVTQVCGGVIVEGIKVTVRWAWPASTGVTSNAREGWASWMVARAVLVILTLVAIAAVSVAGGITVRIVRVAWGVAFS